MHPAKAGCRSSKADETQCHSITAQRLVMEQSGYAGFAAELGHLWAAGHSQPGAKDGESASAKAEQTVGCPRKEANSLLEPNRWLRPEAITTHPTKTGLASCFILDTSYRKKAEKFIPRKLRAKVCF